MCPAFCGCSGKKAEKTPPELNDKFEKSAVLEISGREYKAEFRRGGADIWECEFTSPETVEGLTITLSGEDCKLTCGVLEYDAVRGDIPEYGSVPMLTRCIDDIIAQRDLSCTDNGDTTLCRGTVRGLDFTAEIDDNELISVDISGCVSAKLA